MIMPGAISESAREERNEFEGKNEGENIPAPAVGKGDEETPLSLPLENKPAASKANSSTSKAPAQTPVRRRSKIKPAPRSGKNQTTVETGEEKKPAESPTALPPEKVPTETKLAKVAAPERKTFPDAGAQAFQEQESRDPTDLNKISPTKSTEQTQTSKEQTGESLFSMLGAISSMSTISGSPRSENSTAPATTDMLGGMGSMLGFSPKSTPKASMPSATLKITDESEGEAGSTVDAQQPEEDTAKPPDQASWFGFA
jgi:hypothetical protein